jgi:hypothetical protein
MATFLTTAKMTPEFRARLEANVRGKHALPGSRMAPRSRSWLRLAAFGISILAVGTLAVIVRRDRAELAAARVELSERARREAATLTAEDQRTLERVKQWLERQSGAYAGDTIAAELSGEVGFTNALSRPMIYVRGPIGTFRRAAGVAESAATSRKDAFVACLMDPPASREEKALLVRARTAYGSSDRARDPTAHVAPFRDALAGMPFLGADWLARVSAAESARELQRLRRDFERAPLSQATRAAKSELLLFVMDEPATRPGPVELDGERAHDVRVGLVDFRTQKLLLQLRLPVDPSFISVDVRAEYAGAIDACALAVDTRAAVTRRNPTKG